jgi:hypothetical protein
MSSTSLFQKVGLLQVPAVSGDVTDTLATLDPARDALIALFKSAINDELGDAWTKVAALTGMSGESPVQDTVPFSPSRDILLQTKRTFPCLFLSRDGIGNIDEFALWQDRIRQRWGLHYILGAVDVTVQRQLADVLIRVANVCQLVIHNGRHPSYLSGKYVTEYGISRIQLVSVQAGQAQFAQDPNSPSYAAMSMTLETEELSAFNNPADVSEFTSVDFQFNTGTEEGLPLLVEGIDNAVG